MGYYTTIGTVREVIEEYFCEHQKSIPFTEALKILRQQGKLREERENTDIPKREEYLSEEAFRALLINLPVYTQRILGNSEKKNIDENITIPFGRDVFSYLHLPHVNDGKHWHDYFEMNYVYQGSCIQEIIGEKRQMEEGEVCIIAPYTSHNVLVNDDSLIISIMVRKTTFDAIFGSLMAQNDLLSIFFKNTLYEKEQSNYILFHTENTQHIKSLVQKIVIESNLDDKYASIYCNGVVQILFCTLLREYSDTILYYGYKKEESTKIDFSLLLTYMQKNYSTVTLKSLAEFFHYNETYLSLLIKKNMKQSFSQVLHSLKMKKAVEYLINTDLNIDQIAFRIGYTSPDHFSRYFKKEFKCPPSVYRKNYKNE